MSQRQRRANLVALLLGLAATGVVILAHFVGALDWLELKTLDLRFRYVSAIPEDPRLVCVDIDDAALDLVGRWPWPRDVQAGLISILAEAGARALLYDITLVEPEPVRSITPRDADVGVDPLGLETQAPLLAFPDLELRAALAELGQVYLAFHYSRPAPRTGSGPSLRDHVRIWLDQEPQRWQQSGPELFSELTHEPQVPASPSDALAQALRFVLGEKATQRGAIVPLERVRDAARPIAEITPVYYEHARAARRCGFVVFEPDRDGIMRRTRLLIEHAGHVLPQLAFGVAFDALGLTADDVSATPGSLTLRRRGGNPLVIQLDADGRALVPWVAQRAWTQQFGGHISIGAVWQVYDRRQSLTHNHEVILASLRALLETGQLRDHRPYHDDLTRRLELESEWRLARYRNDAATVAEQQAWIAEYDRLLAEGERTLRAAVAKQIQQTPITRGDTEDSVSRALHQIERALDANDEHRTEIDATLRQLRARVAGKIALVGYTATSLADTTPIPTDPRAPGVVAHANLLSGLLTGHTVRWASPALNVALAIFCGLMASALSVFCSPRAAGLWVLVLLAGVLGLAGAWAFYLHTYWVRLTPAAGAMLVSYFSIGVYRYVFLDRQRRELTTALSQYTSATLARQMAEDAELCRRAETREVTVMFTDLRGFTTISERIGAERTQRVLNLCLGRCSEVMLRYEAMINKFIGDGIFAFWNPVIYPQPDHAVRACETALELQAALRDLIEEQRRSGGDEAFAELVLRIGLASGPAVVGPCGSEQKYDYTCIGDTVNLAARLESANKFYGTCVLVGGDTGALVGTRFVFRPLGGVQVKGKTRPVPIWELLGRSGEVSDAAQQYAHEFGQAVTLFQQRRWEGARTAFEACSQHQPDDLAAARYLDATRRFRAAPPPEDWSGALELAEK